MSGEFSGKTCQEKISTDTRHFANLGTKDVKTKQERDKTYGRALNFQDVGATSNRHGEEGTMLKRIYINHRQISKSRTVAAAQRQQESIYPFSTELEAWWKSPRETEDPSKRLGIEVDPTTRPDMKQTNTAWRKLTDMASSDTVRAGVAECGQISRCLHFELTDIDLGVWVSSHILWCRSCYARPVVNRVKKPTTRQFTIQLESARQLPQWLQGSQ